MKAKFFLIPILLLISVMANSQTNVRVKSETIGFWTVTTDTMNIKKSDAVYKASVYAPSFSTDSVKISGCTFTVDGIKTNGITIPPGVIPANIGANYAFLDSLSIIVKNKAWILLWIDRD